LKSTLSHGLKVADAHPRVREATVRTRVIVGIATMIGVCALASAAVAAETVHLFLKINGSEVQGEGPPGAGGTPIECFAFEVGVISPRDQVGKQTGRRQYQPLTIRKRIDRTSPLLAKALSQNEPADATFHFFRTGTGGQRVHVYTVEIKNAYLAARKEVVASTLDPATASLPAYEEVVFVFGGITWRWVDGGVEFTDSVPPQTMQLQTKIRPPGGS
jgi:type VI secretion system secreted protein Hcp